MKKLFRFNAAYLAVFAILLGVEVLIALFVHDGFVRPFMGDVLVVAVIYCFIRVFTEKIKLLPLWIFLFAAIVEVLQYIRILKLFGFDGNRLLSVIMGGTFDYMDIACYAVGCAGLFLWEQIIRRKRHDK